MNITIIIPTINEASTIRRLIDRLLTADRSKLEIIVVDGGSKDETLTILAEYEAVKVVTCVCSRPKQLNTGAAVASNDVLYFVHADTLPPLGYYQDGFKYLSEGYDAACYRSKFESKHVMLRLNEFFTRFYWLVSRGGDQSLFIRKSIFLELGTFDESMQIMEEYPMIKKLMTSKRMAVVPKYIEICTRKYDDRSWLKVSRANYVAFKLFKKGVKSDVIKKRYQELLG